MKTEYNENDPNFEIDETALGTRIKHPSYATILFSRRSGGKTDLFGSSIHHHDTIACTIYQASLTRGLNTDWISGDNELIQVEMSYSQFAEAITSLNMGTGVPCTLRFVKGQGSMPPCNFVDKKKQFAEELETNLAENNNKMKNLIKDVKDIFEKKSLTKADKTDIIKKLNAIESGMTQHTQFTFEQFQQQMDKTVSEAKGEVEAFVQNKMHQIASAAMIQTNDTPESLIPKDNPINM